MPANRIPWNKGRLLGQKPPLKLKEIWSLRVRLQLANKRRDLALFNLALDSKLRGCDLVSLRVRDVFQGNGVASRAIVMQRKTQRPVQFEITEAARDSVTAWVMHAQLRSANHLFPGRGEAAHVSTRQYARIVKGWVCNIGLDLSRFGTHTHCDAPRRRSFTSGLKISVPVSCYSATPTLKAQFVA